MIILLISIYLISALCCWLCIRSYFNKDKMYNTPTNMEIIAVLFPILNTILMIISIVRWLLASLDKRKFFLLK